MVQMYDIQMTRVHGTPQKTDKIDDIFESPNGSMQIDTDIIQMDHLGSILMSTYEYIRVDMPRGVRGTHPDLFFFFYRKILHAAVSYYIQVSNLLRSVFGRNVLNLQSYSENILK